MWGPQDLAEQLEAWISLWDCSASFKGKRNVHWDVWECVGFLCRHGEFYPCIADLGFVRDRDKRRCDSVGPVTSC